MCEGATREDVRLGLHDTIQRCGCAIQGVETEPGDPPWAYSIGLIAAVGHPELVVVGLDPLTAAGGIEALARRIMAGERCGPGPDGLDVEGLHVHLVEVHPSHLEAGMFASWVDYYGSLGSPRPEFEALQIVVPSRLLGPSGGQPRLDRPASCVGANQPHRAQRRATRHRRG